MTYNNSKIKILKRGKDYPVVAFKTGPRYTLEELKEFTPNYEGNLELKFPEKSKKNKKNLKYYKKNFPEWYQKIITGVSMPANKRNERKREIHLKSLNAIRKFRRDELKEDEYQNKSKPKGSGTKEEFIKEYRKNNQNLTMYRCPKDTGLSKNTIKKYWKLI